MLKKLKFIFPLLYFRYIKLIGYKPKQLLSVPWINEGAIKWLDKYLNKQMTVFEYGSGASTLFMANRVKQIISVEHDPVYYGILKNKVPSNCKLIFSPVAVKPEKYINEVDKYNDLDLVFIDGMLRKECIENSIGKIKNGGYLLLDNSDMAVHYSKMLDKYKKIIFNETTIWQIIN